MKPNRILLMGGCNVRGPLAGARNARRRSLDSNWHGVPDNFRVPGANFLIYTFGEMLQTLAIYKGEISIPAEIRPLCGVALNFAPDLELGLDLFDVILIEPATSFEIHYEGFSLNRAPVLGVLQALRDFYPKAEKAASIWYNRGIVAMKSEARRSAAEELIPVLNDSSLPNKDVIAAFLRDACGFKRDVKQGMRDFLSETSLPVGIVTYTWQYMEDGRPISWPAVFNKEILSSAAKLNVPVLEPCNMVIERGAKLAMKRDLRHYKGSFEPIIAKALVEFAETVASSKRSNDKGGETMTNSQDNAAVFSARPLWFAKLEEPFDAFLAPPPANVGKVHAMIGPDERAFLYNIVKDYYSGEGIILDGGIFMGGSTYAFGAALHANSKKQEILSKWPRPVVSIDRAIATDSMVKTLHRQGIGTGMKAGDSFESIIRKNIEEVDTVIDLRIGDIFQIGQIQDKIEILFLDVLKSAPLSLFAVENYFTKLIPGKSIVIQQDYFIDGLVFIRLHQECLADKFRYIGELGASAVFLCIEEISDAEAKETAIKCRTLPSMRKYLDAACARSQDPYRRLLMMISQIRLLAYRHDLESAKQLMVSVEALVAELNEDKMIPRIRNSVAGARYICQSDGSREKLDKWFEIAYGRTPVVDDAKVS